MRKLLILLSWLPTMLVAQVQQGIVRTTGSEKDANGKPLAGVIVKARGGTNEAVSDKQGHVKIGIESRKEGGAYQLTRIYKKGYELSDPMLLGRRLAYSSKTLLEITMISSKELSRIKTEIEEKVNQQVQQKYSLAIAALNDSLQHGALKVEAFREKMAFLQKQRDLFEPLISSMADHYAHTDFVSLDSTGRQINRLMMMGEIEAADLLIAEKGNLEERLAAIERQRILYGQAADSLVKKLSKALQRQREEYERERDDIASDLYHKYAIALAQFDPHAAGEYITMRAELDTTNTNYQLEAGAFVLEYMSDFENAESYYQRALRQAEQAFGRQSETVALCLNHLGGLSLQASRFTDAIAQRREALEIRKQIFDKHHTGVAACYNNLANIYYGMEKFDEARVCADSAIIVYLQNEDTNLSDLADAYTTKGGIEMAVGNINGALSFYELSVSMTDSIYGEENTHSATTINNIGIIKDHLGQREEATACYYRALALFKKIYGEKHPNVATVYSNLGTMYQETGKVDSSMICHHTALEMRLDLLGEYHEDVAISLNNIGALFSTMKQYDMAVDFYGKALSVINVILGNNTMRFATTLSNIAIVYYRQQNYLSAIDYLDAALKVYIQYPNYAEKEIGTLAKLEKRCYEMLLAGDTLSEEGRAEAQKDYEQLLKDYESYLEHE